MPNLDPTLNLHQVKHKTNKAIAFHELSLDAGVVFALKSITAAPKHCLGAEISCEALNPSTLDLMQPIARRIAGGQIPTDTYGMPIIHLDRMVVDSRELRTTLIDSRVDLKLQIQYRF